MDYADRVIVMKNGKQVASSQNLEVVLRYQRNNSLIIQVKQKKDEDGKKTILYVKYGDGATITTKFADSIVLTEWIRKKKVRGVFP